MRPRRSSRAAFSGAECPPARLAAAGNLRLRPLRAQYVQRHGMGVRRYSGFDVRPCGSGLRPVGADVPGRRNERRDAHGQAPRRVLSLAFGLYRVQREELPVARRQGGFGAGAVRCLPQARTQVRHLSFALGPQSSGIRAGGVCRLFPQPDARTAHRLRAAFRILVRRRERRRRLVRRCGREAQHRRQDLLRLRAGAPDDQRTAARSGDFRRHVRRHPLDRQRRGPGWTDELEHGKGQRRRTAQ